MWDDSVAAEMETAGGACITPKQALSKLESSPGDYELVSVQLAHDGNLSSASGSTIDCTPGTPSPEP